MLKMLNVENFRGIKNIFIDELKQFNLLAGKNNSGKSSILESLFIWANAAYIPNYNFANYVRGFPQFQQPSPDLFYQFFYDASFDNNINIKTVDDAGIIRKVEISGTKPNGFFMTSAEPLITASITEGDEQEKTYQYIGANNEDARGNPIFVLPHQYWWSAFYNADLPQKLTNIIVNKQKRSVIDILKSVDSSIQDFDMVNGNIIMFDVGRPQLVRYEIMGDGIKKVTSLLASAAAAKDGILLIDEFENGLHHSSMDILWRALFKSALENNVQVFVTTHSYECIESFNKMLDEFGNADASVIRIERKNDEHTVVNMSKADISVLLDNNWEIR